MKQLRFAAVAIAVLLALELVSLAQTASNDVSKPAPNAWMLTPTPYLEWNKDVPHSVRVERDRDQDQGAVGQRYPLTSPLSDAPGPGIGDGMPRSDIRPLRNRVTLTGTFTQHRSVLSASEFSLYSEVTIHVDQVFENRSGSDVYTRKDITILISGGTVTLASGRVLTHDTQPVHFSLQPDHKYLLVLEHYRAGEFYLVMDSWDISDGVVRPNTVPGQYRAQHGLSALSGLDVQEIGPALAKLLNASQ